jgi:luciferase family oxidoreductase group 1
MLTLSVLDQSPVRQGVTPRDALLETIELARHVERLGYRRYWLAEHHATPALAGSAPEIMIARIATETSHIRVGSGGVMLSHYSSLKVAEQFRMLETLYPGRIDLGIGRAPGSDQLTAVALQHGPGALGIEHFPNQIADVIGYLEHTIPADHPFSRIRLMPDGETLPEIWGRATRARSSPPISAAPSRSRISSPTRAGRRSWPPTRRSSGRQPSSPRRKRASGSS